MNYCTQSRLYSTLVYQSDVYSGSAAVSLNSCTQNRLYSTLVTTDVDSPKSVNENNIISSSSPDSWPGKGSGDPIPVKKSPKSSKPLRLKKWQNSFITKQVKLHRKSTNDLFYLIGVSDESTPSIKVLPVPSSPVLSIDPSNVTTLPSLPKAPSASAPSFYLYPLVAPPCGRSSKIYDLMTRILTQPLPIPLGE